jgi:hypothetical protein
MIPVENGFNKVLGMLDAPNFAPMSAPTMAPKVSTQQLLESVALKNPLPEQCGGFGCQRTVATCNPRLLSAASIASTSFGV